MQHEIERTFLAKYIPPEVLQSKYIDYQDIYIPFSDLHPKLRVRRKGQEYEITKKVLANSNDASVQQELTIPLSREEYDEFATIHGNRILKRRFFLSVNQKIAEIDVFMGDLAGLVLVEFEFALEQEKDSFAPPDFCLVDVTQEETFAGGKLAGKTYKDITPVLEKYHYQQILLPQ